MRMILLPAAAMLAAAALAGPAAARPAEPLAAQVQRLEDKAAIERVILDYGRLLDARDWRGFSNLFAADGGEWDGGFGVARGREAIYDMMVKQIGPTPGHNYHLLSDIEVDVDGDHARAWSRWSFVNAGAEGRPVLVYGGHYDDDLVRENGAWKIKRRIVSADVAGPPPALKQ